ncbi:lipoprotein [Streptomyces minutiscleroticus]|uniref:Lipoprotein n=1 Tax=Streptomyces minutiscleroticus TaxID=68238 RepID=A0A918NQH9_9ACTN|nr:hypothetical protein [Streptomyces minutiscleroticus]GGX87226.1 lipoprotein [Streptomyces minutiscleroticus]
MRAIRRAASAALVGVTTLALSSCTVASADPGGEEVTTFGYRVSPTTVDAGGEVTLFVTDCRKTARIHSDAFDTVTVPRGEAFATTDVGWDAKPGAVYEVTFRCGRETGHTDLTVAAGHQKRPLHDPGDVQHGVKAGAGGTMDGFDLRRIGLGGALVGGAIGVAYYWSRRRPSGDGAS